MEKLTDSELKLQKVMINLFNFDPYQPLPPAKKFNWPWKSPKPVIRISADSIVKKE